MSLPRVLHATGLRHTRWGHGRILLEPFCFRITRNYATEPHPNPRENLSKEQAELLRLLREANIKTKALQSEVPLGLAGEALQQGSRVGTSKIDKWVGLGKKWQDISGRQKVARVTVGTYRFILVGAGALITLLIAYTVSTELFARNSPTVIYNEACKYIQKSDKVHEYLLEPYRFQTSLTETHGDYSPLNPPSHPHRPSQTVHSMRFVDPRTGAEKLVLHFFMEGQDKDRPLSYWQRLRSGVLVGAKWLQLKAYEAYENVYDLWQQSSSPDRATPAPSSAGKDERQVEPVQPWWITRKLRGFVKGMGQVIGNTNEAFGMSKLDFTSGLRHEPGTFTEGEVHVELIKDEQGVYQYQRFYIDIPHSRSPMCRRVHLDRRRGELPDR